MADISIDEARAQAWLKDVKYELDAVEVVLKNVQTSLQTVAGEDDTIIQGIYKLGTGMEEKWTGMCQQFKETCVEIGEAIVNLSNTAVEIVSGFADILKWLGL